MTRRVAVLRPEPANHVTAARLAQAGVEAIALPLFEIAPVAWTPPDPAAHDGVLLTSANAVRCAGDGLAALRSLPVFVVGEATARAARRAGLEVAAIGNEGAADILRAAGEQGRNRLIHLAGRDRAPHQTGVSTICVVYESREIDRSDADLAPIAGQVAMLHSPRAARRFAMLARAIDRSTVRLAALSPAIAEAAGKGWATIQVAVKREDAALVALARRLAD